LRQTKSGKLGQNKELYHKGPAKHPWLEVAAAAVHQNVRNIGENWENHGEDIRKYDEIVEKTKGWQLLKGVFLELPRLGVVRIGKPARIMNYCHDIWNQRENSTCQYKGRSNTM